MESILKHLRIRKPKIVISPQHPDELTPLTGEQLEPKAPLSFTRAREEVRSMEILMNDLARKIPPTAPPVMIGGALGIMLYTQEVYRKFDEVELVVYESALPKLIETAARYGYDFVSRKTMIHLGGGSKTDIYVSIKPQEVLQELSSIKRDGLPLEKRIVNRNSRLVFKDRHGNIPPHASLSAYWDLDIVYDTTRSDGEKEQAIVCCPEHRFSIPQKEMTPQRYTTEGGIIHGAPLAYILAKKTRRQHALDLTDRTAIEHYFSGMHAVFTPFSFTTIHAIRPNSPQKAKKSDSY